MGFRCSEFHFFIYRDEVCATTLFQKETLKHSILDSYFWILDFGLWDFRILDFCTTLNLLYRFSILLATSTSATNKLWPPGMAFIICLSIFSFSNTAKPLSINEFVRCFHQFVSRSFLSLNSWKRKDFFLSVEDRVFSQFAILKGNHNKYSLKES